MVLDSKQKIDDRVPSNRMNFTNSYNNTLNTNTMKSSTSQFTFSNVKNSKQKSYQIYKSLLIKNRFSKSLLQSKEINYNNYTHIPQELANVNFPL